jgi:hypothetical protein
MDKLVGDGDDDVDDGDGDEEEEEDCDDHEDTNKEVMMKTYP